MLAGGRFHRCGAPAPSTSSTCDGNRPTAKRAYNEGRSTQVPMNPMVRLRGDRFSRKLRYRTMELRLSDEPTAYLRAVADYFGLPGAGPVEKDFARPARDPRPSGTRRCTVRPDLRRRHRARPRAQNRPAHVRGRGFQDRADAGERRSPAVAFAASAAHCGTGSRRRCRPPALPSIRRMMRVKSRDENRYTVYQLPYAADGSGEGVAAHNSDRAELRDRCAHARRRCRCRHSSPKP